MAWNSYPKSAIATDGKYERASIYATQYYLRRYGFYTRELDGGDGYYTRRGIQRYLAYRGKYSGKLDGILGDMSTRSMVNYLSYGGNPYGRPFFDYSSYSGIWPTARVAQSWQSYLNFRR